MDRYYETLSPMIPLGTDVTLGPHGIPYIGCENRILVNKVQYPYIYTDDDLKNDIRGLYNTIHAKRIEQLNELQAHKDLLDHVGYLTSEGQMTKQDLSDTQHTIHESLKDGHNDYYKWFDLGLFPKSFVNYDVGEKNLVSICTYLRKTFRVWYVSFQADRVVMLGSDQDELNKCMAEFCSELAYYAQGDWINHSLGTTQRYTRFRDRLDTEFDNIHLIAKTWCVSEDEAYERLEEETAKEDAFEHILRLFALKYSKI